jgi:hypothetical protein
MNEIIITFSLVITGLKSPVPLQSVESFQQLTKMHFSPELLARVLNIFTNKSFFSESTSKRKEEEHLVQGRESDPNVDFSIYSSLDEKEL